MNETIKGIGLTILLSAALLAGVFLLNMVLGGPGYGPPAHFFF